MGDFIPYAIMFVFLIVLVVGGIGAFVTGQLPSRVYDALIIGLILAFIFFNFVLPILALPPWVRPWVLAVVCIFCGALYISRTYTRALEIGGFAVMRPWVRKLQRRAADLASPLSGAFIPRTLAFQISYFFEQRWRHYTPDERKQKKLEFNNDVTILFLLLHISYEQLLFCGFKGTGVVCVEPGDYRAVFDGVSAELARRGRVTSEEIASANKKIQVLHDYCYENSFALFE